MEHFETIETITRSLRDNAAIRAVFLSGSYSTGFADEYSDIDFLIVARDGATDEVSALCHKAISQTGEIVLWRDRTPRPVLINAITDN